MTRYAVCGECGKNYRAGVRYAAGEPVRRLHEVVSHGGQRVQWRIWGVPGAEDRPTRGARQ